MMLAEGLPGSLFGSYTMNATQDKRQSLCDLCFHMHVASHLWSSALNVIYSRVRLISWVCRADVKNNK